MTSIILKVLALSGVVSAGCFAVWKANTDLGPQTVGQFSEDGAGAAGASPEKAPESEEGIPATEDLALADFPTEAAAAESATPARQMPAAFPAGDPEPLDAATPRQLPVINALEAESTAPEPGVADLDILEDAERRASLPGSDDSPSLQKFPREAGGPELLKTPTRTRSPQGVVPAAGEEEVPETAPPLRQRSPIVPALPLTVEPIPETSSEPIEPLPINETVGPGSFPDATEEPGAGTPIGNASEVAPTEDFSASVPVQPGQPALRTRGPGPARETPPDADSPVPFDQSEPVESIPATTNDNAVPEDLTDTFPPAAARPRVHPLPTTPEPTLSPEEPAAVGGLPRPTRPGSSIPMPVPDAGSRGVNPELLVGDGTVDDGTVKQSQQPQLKIEKIAQAEAEVGVSFIYEIVIQNTGAVDAHDVLVEERIPKGAKLELSKPQGRVSADRIVRFPLDTIPANSQKTIRIQILPLEAGPIGSVATVRFSSKVAAKTVVTAPRLEFTVDAPKEVAVGEQVTYRFLIKNAGQGTARKSTLRVILPEGLHHPKGHDLDQELGVIAPGQSVEKSLTFLAQDVARYSPEFFITANGLEQVNRQLDLSVIESRLHISRKGPARRFVERPAEFETTVMNRSDAPLQGVQVTEILPVGVVPVGDRTGYQWDPKSRTVTWIVGVLGPGHIERLPLTVVARQPGKLAGVISAVDDAQHRAEMPTALEVQGFAALEVDFNGSGVPVNIGEQVSMRLTVRNGGSASAKNVTAVFEVPSQMQFVSGTGQGEVSYSQEGKLVTFAPVDELLPNSTQTYDIVLTAAQEGRANVAADLYVDDQQEKVRQEQQIRVVSDEP
ncbi:MAG: hypothetical protein DWH91_15870 [Planctomycetota bacterium]|nr:MAG: hypothetical protein DWH91_15870 [Planctomycetota bacterium]